MVTNRGRGPDFRRLCRGFCRILMLPGYHETRGAAPIVLDQASPNSPAVL